MLVSVLRAGACGLRYRVTGRDWADPVAEPDVIDRRRTWLPAGVPLLNTGSLPQEIVEEAARIDAPEDELSTDARSDELPPGLQTSADRR